MKTITGNTTYRTQYAIKCIQEGRTDHRQFSSCFEMGDGDEVVRGNTMQQQVEVNVTLMLEAPMTLCEEQIGVAVRDAIQDALDGQMYIVSLCEHPNRVKVLEIKEEAELYGNNQSLNAAP